MIETLQKINKIVPNLTISQLLSIINIINESRLVVNNKLLKDYKEVPHIAIDTSDNKTTSTVNPF